MPDDDVLELQRLFAGEIEERAGRLIAGAAELLEGGPDDERLADMIREGHTIKGTARMMGYSAISDAGKLLEDAWRAVAAGEVEADGSFAASLESLARGLMAAIGADPASGTPALAAGMRQLRRSLTSERLAIEDAGARDGGRSAELGGLLGTLDSWAFGESTRVNAANLFRLINEISSLRVDAEALVAAVADVEASARRGHAAEEHLLRLRSLVAAHEKAVLHAQGDAVDLAAAPLSEITSAFPQLIRYVSRKASKEIRFEMVGDHLTADRQVLDRLSDPLRHLLVNAVQHGVESPEERIAAGKPRTATVALRAEAADNRLSIVVEDDGAGVDWEAVRSAAGDRGVTVDGENVEALRALLFAPDFSTAPPGDLVGDGRGLALVAAAVDALHGTMTLDTVPGAGTRVTLTVPTSRALQDAVLVSAGGQAWGIPELAVLDRLPREVVTVHRRQHRAEMDWGGSVIPVASFAEAVGLEDTARTAAVVVVSSPVGPVGLLVEEDLGRRQVAARELGPVLDGVPHLTGAALLGGGDVIVLVDPSRLTERARGVPAESGPRLRVLVVDDSRGARQLVGGSLASAGFEVDLAGSPTEALSVLAEQSFGAIVLDYLMPTMDGAALAERIRGLGIDAPIVLLSGAATVEDQGRALRAGANAYLDKDDVRKGALATLIRELTV